MFEKTNIVVAFYGKLEVYFPAFLWVSPVGVRSTMGDADKSVLRIHTSRMFLLAAMLVLQNISILISFFCENTVIGTDVLVIFLPNIRLTDMCYAKLNLKLQL